jgi:predicted ATP-dependent protease
MYRPPYIVVANYRIASVAYSLSVQDGGWRPGGVNEKIEGFFDISKARGLDGEQGVLIPSANLKHLMLRQDVVDVVANEQFHVYAVETIDQGIEILTGIPAGQRSEQGSFPEGTTNRKVEHRLIDFAENARAFHAGGNETTIAKTEKKISSS